MFWPGENFVEFAIDVMRAYPNTFIIAYANGETKGYLVTAEAVAEGVAVGGRTTFAFAEILETARSSTLDDLGSLLETIAEARRPSTPPVGRGGKARIT